MRHVLVVVLVVAGLGGSAIGAASASAHQSGCHRWHSCPSDTGSYVCGDLGYACQYPTYPTYPPVSTPTVPIPTVPTFVEPVEPEEPVDTEYLTRSEFKSQAKPMIRRHFRDRPSRFKLGNCRRYSDVKLRCRVGWHDGKYWTSLLTIRETSTQYLFKFQRS